VYHALQPSARLCAGRDILFENLRQPVGPDRLFFNGNAVHSVTPLRDDFAASNAYYYLNFMLRYGSLHRLPGLRHRRPVAASSVYVFLGWNPRVSLILWLVAAVPIIRHLASVPYGHPRIIRIPPTVLDGFPTRGQRRGCRPLCSSLFSAQRGFDILIQPRPIALLFQTPELLMIAVIDGWYSCWSRVVIGASPFLASASFVGTIGEAARKATRRSPRERISADSGSFAFEMYQHLATG
jgi:hypothetical protein